MFTGIIENLGVIKKVERNGTNISYWIESIITPELKIDQSISHQGVCLTVEAIEDNCYKVTAIEETLKKTNLEYWQIDNIINIERCLLFNGRIDGHIVQGHVDTTAKCIKKVDNNGSWEFTFEFPKTFADLIIEKGSIAVNGTSLTCFNITNNTFTVAIIPYTFEHTSIHQVEVETIVNLEFDVIGKYIARRNQIN